MYAYPANFGAQKGHLQIRCQSLYPSISQRRLHSILKFFVTFASVWLFFFFIPDNRVYFFVQKNRSKVSFFVLLIFPSLCFLAVIIRLAIISGFISSNNFQAHRMKPFCKWKFTVIAHFNISK